MIKQLLFMFFTQGIRLFTGALLFMWLARAWGADTFGTFMVPFVAANLVVLLVDYGYNLQVVKEVGRAPGEVAAITGRGLMTKAGLTLVVVLGSLLAWFLIPGTHRFVAIFSFLLVGAIANSFGVFLALPLRALGHFQAETRCTFLANLALAAGVILAQLLGTGPIGVAIAYVFGRGLFLGITWQAYRRLVGNLHFPQRPSYHVVSYLVAGLPYAVHTIVGALYFQVDTLVIHAFMGVREVGIYQAGMRLMMGAMLLADVLVNVYLPRMAQHAVNREKLIPLAARLTRHLTAIGAVGYLVMAGLATGITQAVYGPEYKALISLMPWFGLVLMMRYAGAGWGLLLTVADRQSVRMLAVVGAFVLNLALNVLLIPRAGLQGALIASLVTHVFMNVVYGWFVREHLGTLAWSPRVTGISVIAVTFSVGMTYLPAVPLPWHAAFVLFGTGAVWLLGADREDLGALSRRFGHFYSGRSGRPREHAAGSVPSSTEE